MSASISGTQAPSPVRSHTGLHAPGAIAGSSASDDDDVKLIDNTCDDAEMLDPALEKAEDYFRTSGKARPVKATEKTQITASLAPRIRGLGEEGGPMEIDSKGVMKAITDCLKADHRMYNTCGFMHGDITNRSVCWTIGKDGAVSGVLLDLDDHFSEEPPSPEKGC